MALKISDQLASKAQGFPESSYGANRVTIVLVDNKKIKNVILAWGAEIIKIGGKQVTTQKDINFKLSEVKDIISEL
jgi:hypothetical protein